MAKPELKEKFIELLTQVRSWARNNKIHGNNPEIKIIILNFTGNFNRVLKETDQAFEDFAICEK